MGKNTPGDVVASTAENNTDIAAEYSATTNARDISACDGVNRVPVNYQPPTRSDLERNNRAMRTIIALLAMLMVLLFIGLIFMAYSIFDGDKNGTKSTDNAKSSSTSTGSDNSSSSSELADNSIYSKSQSEIPADTLTLRTDGVIPDHYRGNRDAKVTVVEYADYTCPYCQQLSSTMSELREKYQDKVLFIYRNFNIGHTYSEVTARAAEAAYLAGGEDVYWKFADQLYADDTWVNSVYMNDNELMNKLRGYARNAGVDESNYTNAYNGHIDNGIDTKIAQDLKLGMDSNVQGTPTVIVNGKMIASYKGDTIKRAIEDALK